MSTLLGQNISATYQSLLKIDGNATLNGTIKNITDGLGNTTPLSMSTTLLNISTAFKLSSYGTGARTGTATYNLAVDSVGNVIEVAGGGGGGTTINPSNNVIPVRLDATTFIDSNIENDPNNYLKTSINPTSGNYFGLFIDFGTLISNLGDFNSINNNTYIQVDDVNEQIKFKANTKLVFQGTNLQDNNNRSYTDKNLVIEAPDGHTYYIPLYN